MSRLIDADVLIETFKNTEDSDHCKWSTAGIVDEINFAPTVEVYTKEEVETLLINICSRMKKYCDNKNHADEWVDGFNVGINRMVDLMEEEINVIKE